MPKNLRFCLTIALPFVLAIYSILSTLVFASKQDMFGFSVSIVSFLGWVFAIIMITINEDTIK